MQMQPNIVPLRMPPDLLSVVNFLPKQAAVATYALGIGKSEITLEC